MVAGLTTGLNVSSQSMPSFTIPTLEHVTIGCCEVGGGGGGGVVGGVGVVYGDGVDRGAGGVDCGVVKAPISAMIVRVPEKDSVTPLKSGRSEKETLG
ncbi:hypothetical protein Tco_1581218, partial [Tanacetum coccineum]